MIAASMQLTDSDTEGAEATQLPARKKPAASTSAVSNGQQAKMPKALPTTEIAKTNAQKAKAPKGKAQLKAQPAAVKAAAAESADNSSASNTAIQTAAAAEPDTPKLAASSNNQVEPQAKAKPKGQAKPKGEAKPKCSGKKRKAADDDAASAEKSADTADKSADMPLEPPADVDKSPPAGIPDYKKMLYNKSKIAAIRINKGPQVMSASATNVHCVCCFACSVPEGLVMCSQPASDNNHKNVAHVQ
jgi:hypothetical protein